MRMTNQKKNRLFPALLLLTVIVLLAHTLGLKNISVYRDESYKEQPLKL